MKSDVESFNEGVAALALAGHECPANILAVMLRGNDGAEYTWAANALANVVALAPTDALVALSGREARRARETGEGSPTRRRVELLTAFIGAILADRADATYIGTAHGASPVADPDGEWLTHTQRAAAEMGVEA